MKLLRARVTNYRSVDDSEWFEIDPSVTCLVGKNEAGKSAVLMALAALNPHPATSIELDKERDYPRRHLLEYKTRHNDRDAVGIETQWELEDADVQIVANEFGADVLVERAITILRRYEASTPEWSFKLNFGKVFEFLFSKHKLDATERASLSSAGNSRELIDKLKTLGTPTAKHQALLSELEGFSSVTDRCIKLLSPRLPYLMYFSNYDRMDGAVQVEQLDTMSANGQIDQEQHRGKKLFKDFFDYAGVPLADIKAETRYESFNAKLQSASNRITEQVLEYWTQNPDLEVQVKIEAGLSGDEPPFNTGRVARARIYNQLHKVDTPFSERSAGFIWFFSFLVKFAQVKRDNKPVLLLLDEPGLTLHGTAQADLLRYFDEKLAPHHQIVYSTHSPFMVAADKLLSSRIVEDRVETRGQRRVPIGTKVRSDVLSVDRDTLFPLQGALGYEITQSLFVGKNTLLVEGPSDILYLNALSSALKRKGREGMSPKWTICPAGGLGNIRSFVALFAGNKLNVAVLSDYADGQKAELRKVKDLAVFRSADRVFLATDFVEQLEADVEDFFELELFCDILSRTYGLKGRSAINAVSLKKADEKTSRLVKKAEALFRTPDYASLDFDHYKPSEWLIQNPSLLDGSSEPLTKTLDRAEKFFKALNGLL